jgi:hypothetical protein
MKKNISIFILMTILTVLAGTSGAVANSNELSNQILSEDAAAGSAFTYQGHLSDGDSLANGNYDFRFILYNSDAGGTQVGSTVTKDDVVVTNGLFMTTLDFGTGAFDGDARYLEIAVRSGTSTGAYTVLSPRQELTPTPYSINADLLDGQQGSYYRNADQVDGLHANQIASTAAYAGGDQSLNLDLPDTVVRYVTVNALRSGRVIVNASGYGYLPVDTNYLRCSITTGTALDNSALSIARGASYVPFAMTRGYTVGAGTHRINLVCDANSNQVVVRDTNMTAIYVPGSFGTLSSQETNSATRPVPEGCVDENEDQCGP